MPRADAIYWEEHGPGDGPALILSAGLGGASTYWKPNLASLASRHRVIAYDHRGTGRSDRFLPAEVTEEDMARDVEMLMDHLGIAKATLIGHALGGIVGLSMALLAAERLEGLVIVNGFARADRHFRNCMDIRLNLLRGSGIAAFVRAQPLFLYPARWIVKHFDEIAAEEEAHCLNFQGRETLEARVDLLCACDFEGRLEAVATPTLIVAARDDLLVESSASERLAAGIRGSTLAMMDSGGHACNITEAERFNRIVLDWLDG